MHFPSVEKPQQLEKPQGLWVGGSSLQTPPCPLVCQCVCTGCMFRGVLWSSAVTCLVSRATA